MNLHPQSYYVTRGFLRNLAYIFPFFVALAFYQDPDPHSILFASVFVLFVVFGSLCLIFSKVHITNEKVVLTWSPFKTTMYWKDAKIMKVGIPYGSGAFLGPTLYVRLNNGKLAYFPIYALSEENEMELRENFEFKEMTEKI